MIKITRTDCPDVLKESPVEGDYYKKKTVRQTLYEMQHGKCCYCEHKIPDKGQAQAVEHYRPKSKGKFPHLRNHWENLLLACSQCNGKKSNKFPTDEENQPLIIDPSNPAIDPEEHIEFIVDCSAGDFACVKERNNSLMGRTTINELELWGSPYFRKRLTHLRRLYIDYFMLWEALSDGDRDEALKWKERILEQTLPRRPFAACAREFVKYMEIENIEEKLKIGKKE